MNLAHELALHQGCSRETALAMFSHGRVALDGRTLGMDEIVQDVDAVAGRMLTAGRIELRCVSALTASKVRLQSEGGEQMSLT